LEYLFSSWQKIASRIRLAQKILLLLDYDGTLSPIVERPDIATLPVNVRHLLDKMAYGNHVKIGIISGRSLNDLIPRVGIENIIYAGNHGLEIEGPGLKYTNVSAEEAKPVLKRLYQSLNTELNTIDGIIVEDKGLSLSVHYRQVEVEDIGEVCNIFDQITENDLELGNIKIVSGKKVFEVRPFDAWDKGKAIELLMDRYTKENDTEELLAIFVGDDATDEDGFRIIEDYYGISVFVGDGLTQSSANYFVKSTDEVQKFLEMLAGLKNMKSVSD
jgi:trehalose-phosphatase